MSRGAPIKSIELLAVELRDYFLPICIGIMYIVNIPTIKYQCLYSCNGYSEAFVIVKS